MVSSRSAIETPLRMTRHTRRRPYLPMTAPDSSPPDDPASPSPRQGVQAYSTRRREKEAHAKQTSTSTLGSVRGFDEEPDAGAANGYHNRSSEEEAERCDQHIGLHPALLLLSCGAASTGERASAVRPAPHRARNRQRCATSRTRTAAETSPLRRCPARCDTTAPQILRRRQRRQAMRTALPRRPQDLQCGPARRPLPSDFIAARGSPAGGTRRIIHQRHAARRDRLLVIGRRRVGSSTGCRPQGFLVLGAVEDEIPQLAVVPVPMAVAVAGPHDGIPFDRDERGEGPA